MLVQSDVCNVASLCMRNAADLQATFDNDARLTIATRKKVYDMASAEKALVTGYHLPFSCLGHIEKMAPIIVWGRASDRRAIHIE
jgi:hypothetical protein